MKKFFIFKPKFLPPFSAILIFVFLLIFSLPVFAQSFPDVPQDYANYEAIEYLDEKGIINGYQDGTFGPENLVNRAEAMKIISNALKIEHEGAYDILFPDVLKDQWFFDYVMGAHKAGIITGYKDGTFKPANNVNLAELLKIIMLAGKIDLTAATTAVLTTQNFPDVPKDIWYAPYVSYASEHNIILPNKDGKIHAEKDMTRGEIAEIIYRMMFIMENNSAAFPLHKGWAVYESDFLPFKIKYDNKNWIIIKNRNDVVLFWPDSDFAQFSYGRVYPNSAEIMATVDKNSKKVQMIDYFTNIKNAFPNATYTEFDLSANKALEVLYPEKRTVDWYIYLKNNEVLAIYTEYGNGTMGYLFKKFIKEMLSTLQITEPLPDASAQLLSDILGKVLIEGVGMEFLNKLPDKTIIETDTIGVGTGPVDYYYCNSLDYTFKYERTSDVILDTRKGRTTAF